MAEFLALYKSITVMDYGEDSFGKLTVTNELLEPYLYGSYEESVNFASENNLVPDTDLPNSANKTIM